MSIWNKRLWGSEPKHTPVTEAAKRCARIRAGGSSDVTAPLIAGLLAGLLFFVAGFVVLLAGKLGANPLLAVRGADGWTGWIVLAAGVTAVIVFGGRFERYMHDRHQQRGINREWLIRESRGRKKIPRLWLFLGLATAALSLGGGLLLHDWIFVLYMPSAPLFVAGAAHVSVGLFGRKGAKLVCARCDYPMMSWRGAPIECPECGGGWKAPWGARFGLRAVRWRIVVIGMTAMLASTAMVVVGLTLA